MIKRLERALASWAPEQVADLCALIESGQLGPELVRDALDPGLHRLALVPERITISIDPCKAAEIAAALARIERSARVLHVIDSDIDDGALQ